MDKSLITTAAEATTSRRAFFRGLGLVGLSLAAGGAVSACNRGPSGGGGNGGNGGSQLNLGLSIPFLTTPFFAVLVSYVKQDVKKLGAQALEPTNANQDAGKQLTDVNSLINAGANGILAGLVDNKAIAPALKAAADAKVPFVALDDAPATGRLFAIVRADNKAMGAQAAEHLASLIGGSGQVLSIQGDLATTNGRDRSDGFREWMQQNAPRVEVIERPADWEGPKAGDITATALTQYPDLAGIYMQADTTYGAAVFSALKAAGRLAPAGQPQHMPLVSIDGGAEGLDAVREGTLDALISQPLDLYSKYGVQYLDMAVKGQSLKEGPTDHDSTIVTYQGNLMDLLPAPLVTKDNVDDKGLWGNSELAR
jgi:ribose transport system substrate-binding protein